MMPEWHHLDSSSIMSEQQESMKKKTLKSSSRSFLFSTGLYLSCTSCVLMVSSIGGNELNGKKMNMSTPKEFFFNIFH